MWYTDGVSTASHAKALIVCSVKLQIHKYFSKGENNKKCMKLDMDMSKNILR